MVMKSSYQGELGTDYARVRLVNADISPVYARAIGRKIKGLTIKQAIKYLREVATQKKPLPLTNVRKVSHKKGAGVASGRYPKKASEEIIKAIKQLRANADAKMLNVDTLKIVHFSSNPGNRPRWLGYFKAQQGRRFGQPKLRTRRQHIEIIAKSFEKEATKSPKSKTTPTSNNKTNNKIQNKSK